MPDVRTSSFLLKNNKRNPGIQLMCILEKEVYHEMHSHVKILFSLLTLILIDCISITSRGEDSHD